MRRLWLLLLSLYFPLCATTGVSGIPAPGVIDFSHFQRARYSTVIAAPAGFSPAPDIITPVYNLPAAALFVAVRAVAAAQPRTFVLDNEPQALQAAWVVRSAACNFPDVVEIAVIADGPDESRLIFYSHSLYGWYAYGVNDNRAKTWLAALDLKVTK